MSPNVVTNYKKHLTAALANKGFSTKNLLVLFLGIKHLFHSVT